MNDATAGHYPIERRAGEIERLHVQGDTVAPDAAIMLDKIGVGPGWSCIDIGCGPRGITDLMSARVGPAGRVVGMDGDPVFVEYGKTHAPPNVEFRVGNAYGSDLPASSFDLVHMRFVASTAGDPETLLTEAKRLAKPGGVVALQEPDMAHLECHPPHPAFDKLKTALQGAFSSVGADIGLARDLYRIVRHAGLKDVQYRTFICGIRSLDPLHDYLPSTVTSLHGTIVGTGLLTEAEFQQAVTECRAHLSKPDTCFTLFLVAQVWGRVEK
jgi:ubiquinone/menaquinone biosynthesis C-methylase UbiE